MESEHLMSAAVASCGVEVEAVDMRKCAEVVGGVATYHVDVAVCDGEVMPCEPA